MPRSTYGTACLPQGVRYRLVRYINDYSRLRERQNAEEMIEEIGSIAPPYLREGFHVYLERRSFARRYAYCRLLIRPQTSLLRPLLESLNELEADEEGLHLGLRAAHGMIVSAGRIDPAVRELWNSLVIKLGSKRRRGLRLLLRSEAVGKAAAAKKSDEKKPKAAKKSAKKKVTRKFK